MLANKLILLSGAPVDVFLVAGQSNAVVNNTTLGAVPSHLTASDAGVKIWDKATQSWLTYDVTVNSNQPGDTSPSVGAYWGPEAEFAFIYRQKNPGKSCYIIKFAIGSTQLGQSGDGATTSDWSPASTGELYALASAEIATGLAKLRSQGLRPTVRALLWVQGESDTLSDALANAYQANLGSFETTIRQSWRLGSGGLFLIGQIQASVWGARGTTVANAQAAVVAANPGYDRLIDTSGYTRGGDGVHFNDAFVAQFGLDLWTAYRSAGNDNVLNNGGFDTADLTGWNGRSFNGTSSVADNTVRSIVGGRARVTNSVGHTFANMQFAMRQLTIGRTYSIGANVFPGQPGLIRVTTNVDGANGIIYDSGSLAGNTTISTTFVATAALHYFNMFANSGSAGFCEYDNVSVV